jgi:hypothetical protein
MTSNPATPTIYVVYLPYLPIRDRVDLGVWELIPRGSLIDQDTVDAEVAILAAGFADLTHSHARLCHRR